jgi:exosortase E/protease (VPEID-CTERM system)
LALGLHALQAEFGTPGSAPARWRSLQPLFFLAALFTAEIIFLTTWLDTATLSRNSALLSWIEAFGAQALRASVIFGAVFVTFGFLKLEPAERAPFQIRGGFLAAHFVGMGLVCGSSYLLFGTNGSDAVAVAWLACGSASIALGALAFVALDDWIRIAGSTGYLWIYALLAAVAFLAIGRVADLTWQPLSSLTIHLVAAALSLFVSPVVIDPATQLICAPHFEVNVAPACSGFEGMGLMLAFGTAWLILFRKEMRFPQAMLLLPAGVVTMYLLNVVRIVALMLIGNAGAPAIAVGGFHSQAGWIAFAGASLGFSFIAGRVPWFMRGVSTPSTAAEDNPTTAYLLPFLAILAAGMAATAVSAGFEWLYALRLVAAVGVLAIYRASYRTLDWRFSWRGIAAGAAMFLLWIGLDRLRGVAFHGAMPAALAAAPPTLRVSWIATRALAATVTVPIAEELAFRGFLLRRFVSADFETVAWRAVGWLPLLLSSVLFGLMHDGRWIGGVAAGLLYGWLAIRTGKLGEAIAAHAATNTLIAICVLAAGQWQLW